MALTCRCLYRTLPRSAVHRGVSRRCRILTSNCVRHDVKFNTTDVMVENNLELNDADDDNDDNNSSSRFQAQTQIFQPCAIRDFAMRSSRFSLPRLTARADWLTGWLAWRISLKAEAHSSMRFWHDHAPSFLVFGR